MTPIRLAQFLLFCLLLHSCEQEKPDTTAAVDEVKRSEAKREYSDSSFRFVEYDSAHCRIQYKYFLNKGGLFAVHIIDTLQKVDSVTYFKNNLPSFTRKTTVPNSINIGKWYTLHPKRSVYANYDDSSNVNYWEALDIAQKRGFSLPEIEVSLLREGDQDSWMFYKLNNARTSTTLLVNCGNGAVKEMKIRPQ